MRQGNVNYRIYNIRLNGGTLRNGGYGQSMNGTKSDGSLGHLTLTADSTIETAWTGRSTANRARIPQIWHY